MTEIQVMILSLLLFIAYRVVNPANERDMKYLDTHRKNLQRIIEDGMKDSENE